MSVFIMLRFAQPRGLLLLVMGGWLGLMTGCSGQNSGASGTNDAEMVAVSESNSDAQVISEESSPTAGAEAAATNTVEPGAEAAPASEPAAETASPPPAAEGNPETAALKAEIEKLKQGDVDRQAEIQALRVTISGLETNLAAAQAVAQKNLDDLKPLQDENEKLKAENTRLLHLDYNEYARLVELSQKAPDEALKEWPLFIEKFPLSPLNKEAQAQWKETDRRVKNAWQDKYSGKAIYTDRAPIIRP